MDRDTCYDTLGDLRRSATGRDGATRRPSLGLRDSDDDDDDDDDDIATQVCGKGEGRSATSVEVI